MRTVPVTDDEGDVARRCRVCHHEIGVNTHEAVTLHRRCRGAGNAECDAVVTEEISSDAITAALRVAVLRVPPVGRLDRIRPQSDGGGVVDESIRLDRVLLPMLDGDADAVRLEMVPDHARPEAVSAPQSMIASHDAILDERIAAERCLHPVRRREAVIVRVDKVVVRATFASIHRRLPGPEKEPVTAVRHRVEGDDVATALLIEENPRGILPAPVEAVTVAANVVVHLVVHDPVVARPIETDAEPGIEGEAVAPHQERLTPRHQERGHPLLRDVSADLAAVYVLQIHGGAQAKPFTVLVMME